MSAYCQKFDDCAPVAISVVYGDLAGCEARLKIGCVADMKLADSGQTPASIAACANVLPTATCQDVLERNLPACAPTGQRPNGAACGSGSQCTSGYCAQTTATCGVCAALVGGGGSCTVDDDCEPLLVCNDLGRCIAPGRAGTLCDDDHPCDDGFYCSSSGSCAATLTTAGAACTDDGSCEPLRGLYCNGTVCARILAAQAGGACGVVGGTVFVACSAGQCISPDLTNDPNSGTCASLAGDGEACGTAAATGVDCQPPSTCVNGRCALRNGNACN